MSNTLQRYAPLVLFVYNRPDHVKKCLDAIERNLLVAETDFFIFSDGAKDDADQYAVDAVRKIIRSFAQSNCFRRVVIHENMQNFGLANSVITGVTKIISEYGNVIVLEDDLITSKDYLRFMNNALKYYKDDKKIWSIAGFTPDLKSLRRYKYDVWFCDRAGSWGWATWLDRWATIDWNVSDYAMFVNNSSLVKKFQKRGFNMPELLDKQMNGQIDSWAIRFCYEQFKQNKYTVNPTVSRTLNIGFDGTGTHGEIHRKWGVELYAGDDTQIFMPYRSNRKISKEYYYYMAQYPIVRFVRKIWKNTKETLGIKKHIGLFD